MALRQSREIPKDAVALDKVEATNYVWEVVNNWESFSDTWALRYAPMVLGGVSALSGIIVNDHYRKRFKLGNFGFFSSVIPISVMPGLMTALFHRHIISTNMLLMKNEGCPVCYEIRSAVIQWGFGIAYPMVLGPTSALMVCYVRIKPTSIFIRLLYDEIINIGNEGASSPRVDPENSAPSPRVAPSPQPHRSVSPQREPPCCASPRQEPQRPASPQPGPSSAPDLPAGQTDAITSTPQDQELDEDILLMLGEAPKPATALGKSIHKDIASRWQEILHKGLQKEVKDKLQQEYLVPSNCELLIAPALNPEAKAALPENLLKRDISIMQKQKQLGLAVSALAQAVDLLIKQESTPQKILKPISDACRILCDSHYLETKTRRNFVISSINAKLKDTLINTVRDGFLFGDNVTEKLKVAKSIQKSGDTLKNTPKPFNNSFNKINFTAKGKNQKGNLNFKTLHRKTPNKPAAGTSRPPQQSSRASGSHRAQARSPPRKSYRK